MKKRLREKPKKERVLVRKRDREVEFSISKKASGVDAFFVCYLCGLNFLMNEIC